MRRLDSISLVFFGLVGTLVAIMLYAHLTYFSLQSYLVTCGQVLSTTSLRHGDRSDIVGKPSLLVVNEIFLRYEYFVDSVSYSGLGRIKGGHHLNSGALLEVYYDPENPESSTLDRSYDWAQFLALYIFLLVVLFAEWKWYKYRSKNSTTMD